MWKSHLRPVMSKVVSMLLHCGANVESVEEEWWVNLYKLTHYLSLSRIVYDPGEVNFLCCSVHFFEFKKFRIRIFLELENKGKCLPLHLSIFKLSCKISISTKSQKNSIIISISLVIVSLDVVEQHNKNAHANNTLRIA